MIKSKRLRRWPEGQLYPRSIFQQPVKPETSSDAIRQVKVWRFRRNSNRKAWMYSARLIDHFEHPRNAGDLADADARARVENPACGDILELAIEVDDGRIREIRFRAKGCVPAMACGSLITELVSGRTIEEAIAVTKDKVAEEIGGLPPASGHAAQLAVDAVRAVVKKATLHG